MSDVRAVRLRLKGLGVVSVVALAVAACWPQVTRAPLRARETTLREDLFTFRSCIDHYYADKGQYPESLDTLVSAKYIRRIPMDPFTHSDHTWRLIRDDSGLVIDVRSGSSGVASDGTRYETW